MPVNNSRNIYMLSAVNVKPVLLKVCIQLDSILFSFSSSNSSTGPAAAIQKDTLTFLFTSVS